MRMQNKNSYQSAKIFWPYNIFLSNLGTMEIRNVFFGIILYVLHVNGTILKDACDGLEEGTRLPHSTQCDRFMICRSQRIYSIGRCPRGLHFNRYLGVCDFKFRAHCDTYLPMPSLKTMSKSSSYVENCCSGCDCCNFINGPLYRPIAADDMHLPGSNGPFTGPSGITCNTKGACENQPDGAMFPISGSHGYIVCQCECEIQMSCPSGLMFNPVLKVCDWPIFHPDAERTTSIRTTTYLPSTPNYPTSSDTSSIRSDTSTKSTSSLTSNPTPNYPTSSDISSILTDTSTKSSTSLTTNAAAGPSGTTCNIKGVCENQPDGAMFPISGSHGYIVCQCECEILMPCPPSLIFNPVLKVCDWPIINPNTESTLSIRATTVLPSTPNYPTSSDTSSIRTDISTKSTTSLTSNPTPNYPTSYDTSSILTETSTKSTSSLTNNPVPGPSGTTCNTKGVCENQPDGAMFPNNGSHGYILCQCECEIPMPCPPNLMFNPVLKVCDWPSSGMIPSPNSPSTGPSGTVCNNKGKCIGLKDGTLFADPNTNGYIVCQCECEVTMPCPNGLIFNPIVNICDWPSTFL